MAVLRQVESTESIFGLQAAGHLMTEIVAPWVQDLGLLVETIESSRPRGAPPDWHPGAVTRLPYSQKLCGDDGAVCGQALMAAADAAMVFACSATWNGYRPMSAVDQITHFLRPVNSDILADARVMKVSLTTSFGRVTLISASDGKPVGMVSSAYALL